MSDGLARVGAFSFPGPLCSCGVRACTANHSRRQGRRVVRGMWRRWWRRLR